MQNYTLMIYNSQVIHKQSYMLMKLITNIKHIVTNNFRVYSDIHAH